MLEPLEVEIRTLHAILGSAQDPDGRAFAPLADAYRRAGQPRKAFGLLTDGLARLPDFASGHVVAARLYAEQGLMEEGEIAARRALELDPENVSALAVLVRVLDGTGRAEEAEEAFSTLEALEPEIVGEEGVTRPEPVLDVGALAPDEDEAVMDVASLAPDDDEPVMDVSSLAPDPDDVMDVSSLAPDPDDDVMDVASLAPDPEEPILDVSALAPDAEEPVLDVDALAPDEDEPVVDVTSLAPDEPVLDVTSLAPEPDQPGAEEEAVLDVGALAPAPANPGSGGEDAPRRPEPREGGAPRIYTRTLGELYAKQGFLDRAVEVFRQLKSEHPEDEGLAERLRELEDRLSGAPPSPDDASEEAPAAPPTDAVDDGERARARDEELEALARDLAEHRERQPDIDTPFAWTGSESPEGADDAEEEDEGQSIGTYFDELLSYRPRGEGA